MAWREFIASLVDSLAWPTALVAVLCIFRTTIAQLLAGELRTLKAGPVQMEWDRTIAKLDDSDAQPLEAIPDDPLGLSAQAQADPAIAISRAYRRLEFALRQVLATVGDEPPSGLDAPTLARRALSRELVQESMVRGMDGVQTLHTIATYSPPTTEQAMQFLILADTLQSALQTQMKGNAVRAR